MTGLVGGIATEVRAYIDAFLSGLPGRTGNRLRTWYLSHRFQRSGPQLAIERGCRFLGPESMRFGAAVSCGERGFFAAEGGEIEVGDRVAFNANVHVNASLGKCIRIGNNVLFGPNVVLRSADHRVDRTDIPIRDQGHVAGEIVIEDDVWVAANVVVVGGVRIGRGAVVAAGAVVVSDVAPMSIVGGVPARLIRTRGAGASE